MPRLIMPWKNLAKRSPSHRRASVALVTLSTPKKRGLVEEVPWLDWATYCTAVLNRNFVDEPQD